MHAFIITALLAAGEEATAVAEAEPTNPVLPTGPELVWAAGSFLVLLVLMIWVAVPAVQRTMNARATKITDDTDAADRAQADADRLVVDYKAKLAEAQAEASRIIDLVRTEAAEAQRALRVEADAELAEVRKATMAEVSAAKESALVRLRNEVDGIAVELAEKVIGRPIDRSAQVAWLTDQHGEDSA